MSCEFARQDGSYVLGALSPAEHQRFEQHLEWCTECARSVRELAGLPGLLAKVDAEVLEAAVVAEPVPDTLLPALIHEVRRSQRRRLVTTAGLAAAATLVVAAGSLSLTGSFEPHQPGLTAGPPSSLGTVATGRTMRTLGHTPVQADLALTSVPWGTRLDLTCTYSVGGDYRTAPAQGYAMFVRTREGRVEQVATWRNLPGRTMRLAAATSTSRQDITSVEVRTADGHPVLELVA